MVNATEMISGGNEQTGVARMLDTENAQVFSGASNREEISSVSNREEAGAARMLGAEKEQAISEDTKRALGQASVGYVVDLKGDELDKTTYKELKKGIDKFKMKDATGKEDVNLNAMADFRDKLMAESLSNSFNRKFGGAAAAGEEIMTGNETVVNGKTDSEVLDIADVVDGAKQGANDMVIGPDGQMMVTETGAETETKAETETETETGTGTEAETETETVTETETSGGGQ